MSETQQAGPKMMRNDGGKGNQQQHFDTKETDIVVTSDDATDTTTTEVPAVMNNTETLQNNSINVCSMKDGAMILFATDEWFAAADHLLLDTPPIFDPNLYCSQGKVMDGWETQRKRQVGHDFCIIQLSQRVTSITSIEMDTGYFTGNQTPYISLQTTDLGSPTVNSDNTDGNSTDERTVNFVKNIPNSTQRLLLQMKRQQLQLQLQRKNNELKMDDAVAMEVDEYRGTFATKDEISHAKWACSQFGGDWQDVLTMVPLRPGYETTRYHHFDATTHTTLPTVTGATHVRLNYYPDGGMARLRIYGIPENETIDDMATCCRTMTIPKPLLHRPIQTCDACSVHRYLDHDDASDYKSGADIIMHNLQEKTPVCFRFIEVSSSLLGGKGIYCSNQHYGTPDQLLRPTSGIDMSDGWETARQPLRPKILQLLKASSTVDDPRCGTLVDFGHLMEYCILELGRPISFIDRIVIDTQHFKGNYPESVELAGCSITEMNHENSSEDAKTESDDVAATSVDWANDTFTAGGGDNKETKSIQWYPILDRCRLSPHALHLYDTEQIQFNINHKGVDGITATVPKLSHVRVRIFPDGGLSRIRIYTPTDKSLTAHTLMS